MNFELQPTGWSSQNNSQSEGIIVAIQKSQHRYIAQKLVDFGVLGQFHSENRSSARKSAHKRFLTLLLSEQSLITLEKWSCHDERGVYSTQHSASGTGSSRCSPRGHICLDRRAVSRNLCLVWSSAGTVGKSRWDSQSSLVARGHHIRPSSGRSWTRCPEELWGKCVRDRCSHQHVGLQTPP